MIPNTNSSRKQFKERCTELLKPLEQEFGIEFTFGPLTQIYNGGRSKVEFRNVSNPSTDVIGAGAECGMDADPDTLLAGKGKDPQSFLLR